MRRGRLDAVGAAAAAQTLITDVSVGSYPVAIAVNADKQDLRRQPEQQQPDGHRRSNEPDASRWRRDFSHGAGDQSVTNKIYVANGNSNSVTVVDGE